MDEQRKLPKLTNAELQKYLDANIREKARWKISDALEGGSPGDLIGAGINGTKLRQVAQAIMDSIISSFDYDEMLLKATRSVKKFNVSYVNRVLKAGLKKGLIKTENAKLAKDVAEAIEEAKKSQKERWVTIGGKRLRFVGGKLQSRKKKGKKGKKELATFKAKLKSKALQKKIFGR